jgi:hypothetical protein
MTTIKAAVDDLFNHPQLPAEQAFDRHYAASFRQRINGAWSERPELVARIVDLREVVERATITVLDELIDGDRYAERLVIDLLNRDGQRLVQEVYVFATRDADGRFVQIEETTLALEGG